MALSSGIAASVRLQRNIFGGLRSVAQRCYLAAPVKVICESRRCPRLHSQKRANYSVKNAETVMAGSDCSGTPLHARASGGYSLAFAQRNRRRVFVIDGELTVETRGPDDYRTLCVGERYRVNAQHAHQTSNRGAKDCRFLIVQGVGRYDFNHLR